MGGLRRILAFAALLSAGGWAVFAQVPEGAEARRALRAVISADRDAAEALYREQVAQCRTRFVVSSCLEAARKERHDTLKRLDSQQTAIDDVEREERATERREEIARKQADAEARSHESEARARDAAAQRAAAPKRSTAPAAREMPAHKGKAPPSPQERAAEEASARAAYAMKQLQAEARRQEAARRNAEHAKKTKPAAPLPLVPGEIAASPQGASDAAPAGTAASSP